MRLSLILLATAALFSSMLSVGCGSEGDLGECPTDSVTAQTAGYDIVGGRCRTCHSSANTGAARQGAPDDLNFDDLATVKAEAGEMYSEAESGAMPPSGPKVTGADLENMKIWLACGAPNLAHD